ncbi:ABC transporter [Catenulispora rubra]|uniref:ABC transporter n=1 Tax=Catenulispora rubra TaxID=280293 RepID=UPI001892699B|nr:ABC transporter [Catenulispora rubra]
MPVTVRVAAALLRPTVRATHWGPFLATTATGLTIVCVPAAFTDRMLPGTLVTLLRLAAVCAALGATFLLDDPSAPTTATTATPRLVRQLVRTLVVLPALAASVCIAWWIASALHSSGIPDPLETLGIEAAALYATALAIAAARLRGSLDGVAGPFAVAVLLLAIGVTLLLPESITLFPSPSAPRWHQVHVQWTAILTIAVLGYLWAASDHVR